MSILFKSLYMYLCFNSALSATYKTARERQSFFIIKYSLSKRSILLCLSWASSANFADVLTPSPDFCVFSIMAQARRTNAGTVSCFSCFGMSTKVQYCVSSLITSYVKNVTRLRAVMCNRNGLFGKKFFLETYRLVHTL